MATLPFVPTPCVVNVSTFEKDVQVGAVKLTGGRSYTTWQLHDATIIPLSLAEAVERVVTLRREMIACAQIADDYNGENATANMQFNSTARAYENALANLLTLWPEAQPNG